MRHRHTGDSYGGLRDPQLDNIAATAQTEAVTDTARLLLCMCQLSILHELYAQSDVHVSAVHNEGTSAGSAQSHPWTTNAANPRQSTW